MHPTQQAIIDRLNVTPPFTGPDDLRREIERRVAFIAQTLRASGCTTLVLGISGGVDSLLAGRLAQLAVDGLRVPDDAPGWRFIALRLPYRTQFDEADAQAALAFIRPDEVHRVAIDGAVAALTAPLPLLLPERALGNVKARLRMVAQYAVANASNGLVIGTDHAAEAVMGFFTKHGDGACDLAPLAGLVKGQVRALAEALGAPRHLVHKVPTADLEDDHPGLPDEVAHGVRYAAIDAFLHGESVEAEDFQRIVRAFAASRHKRALPTVP